MTPFDENGVFRSPAELSGVRQLATRGAGATILSGGVGLAVQIIATVVLARLLTPSDFGVVTIVTTFSLLLTNFGLNGFTEAVLQREEINHFLASNLFWINLGVGIFLTLGFAASGSLLAKFFGDPRVTRVAIGASLTILITSVSVLHLALLKRAMRFSALSANDFISRTVSVAISILLGWAGWGYWALVAGIIALPLSVTIGAWLLCPWLPSFPRRVEGTGPMVRYAMNVYARFGVNYATRNLDNFLVGWRFSATSLGFYKKAYDLFALPATQLVSNVTVVAVSAMSRLNQNGAQYKKYFLAALSVLAFVGMGVSADLTLVGKDLIRVLLGPGWETAGRIFTFFGPGIGVMLLYYTNAWIHLSIGTADRWLRWGVVEVTVTAFLFLVGLHWGPVGIATAWTASFWILTLPAFWYAGKPIAFGIGPVVSAVWRYALAALLAGFVSAAIMTRMPSLIAAPGMGGAIARLAIVSLVVGTIYLILVVLLHGGFAPVRQLVNLMMEMVPWRRLTPATAEADAVTAILTSATE